MGTQATAPDLPAAGWRLKLGVVIFLLSIVVPVAGVPAVAAFGMSAAMTASVSGILLASGEGLGILAVAVMGKPGYLYMKGLLFGFLRQYGPPKEVSRLRYRIGLIMFLVPVLFGWFAGYGADMIPGYAEDPLPYAIGGDLLLLASLFVLEGDFWDKIRSLFVHGSEVRFLQG